MSIFYNATPAEFQPVLSDGIYFTLSSDTYNPLSTFKFKFNYELYVEDLLVFQGKCTPNPYGLGILDLQQILETYTDSLPLSYWDTTPIYTHQTFPFSRPLNTETISYYVKTGYEFADSALGSISGFTGYGNALGPPAVQSLPYKVFRSTMGVNPKATQQSFNIGQFVLSGTPVGTNPTTSNLFLTNAPRTLDVLEDDYFTLGFTNYYLWSGGTTGFSEGYYVKYTFIDDQGAVITATTYDNIVSNGGGPRTNCNYVYQQLPLLFPPTGTTDYNTLYVGAGPANIPNLPANAAQYTVQLYGKFTGSTTPIPVPITPTPTPSVTATPNSTPTPTPTPYCTGCTQYNISYDGGFIPYTASYQNCFTGKYGTLFLQPDVSYTVCSCVEPVLSVGGAIVTNVGTCQILYPTPTPTSTPFSCNCVEYTVVNNTPYTDKLTWLDCNGVPQSYNLPGTTSKAPFCACNGTLTYAYSDVTIGVGSCGPTPTPTPTPTNTPTAKCATCYPINISNNHKDNSCFVQYFNCTTNAWVGVTLGPLQTTFVACACTSILETCDDVTVTTAGGACN